MTEEEIMELPEANSLCYRFEDTLVKGRIVRKVLRDESDRFVLLFKEGDPLLVAAGGKWWQVGRGPNNRKYKQEIYPPW